MANWRRVRLGDIPQGWEVKRVPECVDINPRVVVPRNGEKPFVPMGCLSNDSMLITDIESRVGNSGAKFENGDTLFARITPCLENGITRKLVIKLRSQKVRTLPILLTHQAATWGVSRWAYPLPVVDMVFQPDRHVRTSMPHAYAEDQLVEQPAIGLLAELGWTTVSAVERLNPSLPPEIISSAGISGKSRGSPGGEDTVLSEVTAVKKELDLNEWLAVRCCKSLISSRFLFE